MMSSNSAPLVNTKLGLVRGRYEENPDGTLYTFMGIPYGKVPKDNPFGVPLEAEPWQGILDANDESVRCPQREEFHKTLVGDFDCLKLNVYLPVLRHTTNPLPVYFWVYGGEFKFGFASRYLWGPEYLIRHDIILVTINYRSGIYGHLCLDIPEVPGNAGLRDIGLGLKWVNENIASFDGDPNRIIIGGSSSGSFAVEYLAASKTIEGLYHGIILESSSAVSAYWSNSDSKKYVLDVANVTGFKGDLTINAAWKHIAKLDPYEVIKATEELNLSYYFCVEKHFDNIEAVINAPLSKLILDKTFKSVDTLLGFSEYESFSETASKDDGIPLKAVHGLRFNNENDTEKLKHLIRIFYLGNKSISDSSNYEVSAIRSDYEFIYPIYRSAMAHSKSAKVYYYMFAYDGSINFYKHRHGVKSPGALHADELSYLFKQFEFYKELGVVPNELDILVRNRMTKMWTNFIKYGDPTPVVSKLLPVKWLPIDGNVTNYLIINTTLRMDAQPMRERIAFWELIYMNYFDGS